MDAQKGAAQSGATPASLMSTDEAATYLSAKPLTLVAWRHKKQGPTYVKIGGHVRYRRVDLDGYIAQNERKAVAA